MGIVSPILITTARWISTSIFFDDYNTLYINDGDGNFSDKTASAGLVTRRFRSSAGAPLRSTLTMTAGPTFSYQRPRLSSGRPAGLGNDLAAAAAAFPKS